jgi:hypothetical protein
MKLILVTDFSLRKGDERWSLGSDEQWQFIRPLLPPKARRNCVVMVLMTQEKLGSILGSEALRQ